MSVVGATGRPVSAEARFNALFTRHYPAVYGYAARRVGREAAADAAADVFTVAWRRLSRVPAEPETLPWLYAVARRVVANHERSATRRRRLAAKAATHSLPTAPAATPEVEAALDRLSPLDREILRLAAWEELTPAEIAGAVGCSPNAAAVRLHRARRRLAAIMQQGAPR